MRRTSVGLLLALAGCQQPAPVVVDTACDWVRPIYVSSQDQLTRATAAAILAHDEKVAANCGGDK